MIYTLTLNPSIDYAMEMEHLKMGGTNYSENEYMLPGGKGINVSRILSQLGVKNQALGFIGGFTGRFIEEWLAKEQVSTDFVHIKEPTRINVKLKGEQETEINGQGPAIQKEESQQLLEQIRQLHAKDRLIISGSKSKGLPEDYYLQIIKQLHANNVSFVMDTNSKELLEALTYQPFLIKPNQQELGDLFGVEIDSIEKAVHYGKKLQEAGAQHVIVSLGGAGALFIDEMKAYQANAPKGTVINTVGSGDSMIGGFLAGIEKDLSKIEAFKLAVQSGSATAFSTDLATKEEIEALNNQVQIREVE